MSFLGMATGSTMAGQKTITTALNTPQPTFSNIVWMFGFDTEGATDAPTDLSDRSATMARTATGGYPTIQSTTTKFSSAGAAEFNGGGTSRYTENDHVDLEMGSSDFSIEAFVNFDTVVTSGGNGDNHALTACWHTSSERSFLWKWQSSVNSMRFSYSTAGGAGSTTDVDFSWTPTADTWYHLAICRDGTNLRQFVDGVQIGSTYNISTDSLHNSTRQKHVGYSNITGDDCLDGFIDEFRWVIGEAIYTQNFDPPTGAHPRS